MNDNETKYQTFLTDLELMYRNGVLTYESYCDRLEFLQLMRRIWATGTK